MKELELFHSFDNNKLIDIVKNYRQYKYDVQLKELAIKILYERGITEDDLRLTGNNTNYVYNRAEDSYKQYSKLSAIAFILYIVWFVFNVLIKISVVGNEGPILIVYIVVIVAYFILLLRSFMEYGNFFKAIGKSDQAGGALVYIFLGMPFYLFLYFHYRNQMKEEMQAIR